MAIELHRQPAMGGRTRHFRQNYDKRDAKYVALDTYDLSHKLVY